MNECGVDHPALPSLFDPSVPDNPVLWAVFTGRQGGRALVDDVQHPSQCVLRTDAVMTFASPGVSQAFLDRAIARFRTSGDVWLIWPPATTSPLIAPEADSVIPRFEFLDCDAGSPVLAAWRDRLPEGCEIRAIDRELLERCEWRSEMEFFCGSVDGFLANGLGLCLMRGDEILVEAYAAPLGETHAEIGPITHQAYRGRGYAPVACAYIIQLCQERGLDVIWSCDADNLASIRVAQKLGFRRQRAYQIHEYSALG